MERLKFIDYKGKRIFICNYANMSGEEEDLIISMVEGEKREMAKHPPKSLLVLTNVSNMYASKRIDKAFTEMIQHNRPYIKRSAVLGVVGLKKIIYGVMIALTGRDIKVFERIADAKDWLVKE